MKKAYLQWRIGGANDTNFIVVVQIVYLHQQSCDKQTTNDAQKVLQKQIDRYRHICTPHDDGRCCSVYGGDVCRFVVTC